MWAQQKFNFMHHIHGLTATVKDSTRKEVRIALLHFHKIQDVIQQKPILMNTTGIKDFFSEVRSLIPDKIITETARNSETIENLTEGLNSKVSLLVVH